jgi:hypothetical protein
MSNHQNAGQNHNMNTGNKSLESLVNFKYLIKTETNQNLIKKKVKSKINSGNA